jgi:hypothetical protein
MSSTTTMSMSSLVSNFSADNEWRHCPQYAGNKKAGRPKVEKRKKSAIEKYGKKKRSKPTIDQQIETEARNAKKSGGKK